MLELSRPSLGTKFSDPIGRRRFAQIALSQLTRFPALFGTGAQPHAAFAAQFHWRPRCDCLALRGERYTQARLVRSDPLIPTPGKRRFKLTDGWVIPRCDRPSRGLPRFLHFGAA
jgi:hypothetical protein